MGIRVVDLSWIVGGPTCTTVLAEFVAEVIKVESRDVLDPRQRGVGGRLR